MMVSFASRDHIDFAAQFICRPKNTFFGAKPHWDELAIEVEDPYAAGLFSRLSTDGPVVLPFPNADKDSWLITGKDRKTLDQALMQVSRFLVPTYAEYADGSSPQLRLFAGETQFQQLGARLYPVGYYKLNSPRQYRDHILRRLHLWHQVLASQPAAHVTAHQTYRDLHSAFTSALAARNWTEAERALSDVRAQNLSTADNLEFLQIQLLWQQDRWTDIWDYPHFTSIARMHMPRAVRRALITAFHHSVLLPLEKGEDWEQALERFAENRPRLGELLTARLGITEAPVLRVFAYQAAYLKDLDSFAAVAELLAKDGDPITARLLQYLRGLLPPPPIVSPPLTAQQRARLALDELDLDAALEAAEQIESTMQQCRLFVMIASQSGDAALAERALLLYYDLSDDEKDQLQQTDRYVSIYIADLELLTSPEPEPQPAPPTIESWLDWFELAKTAPETSELGPAIDRLANTTDERFWIAEHVLRLIDYLYTVALEHEFNGRTVVQRAVRALVEGFLNDKGFPRHDECYADLYEVLYTAYMDCARVNETTCSSLLRLAEARLRHDPSVATTTFEHVRNWMGTPVPALEDCALEALDLMADYGLPPSLLPHWYREWVTTLLTHPTARDRTRLQTWLAFGEWIQPGTDLITKLHETLESDEQAEDPLALLPSGYRISIFTLRLGSAQRARNILLERNPSLIVKICEEKDLNRQAQAMAENADMPVIVTTCLTHALYYGITPHLKTDPVMPESSGTSSILRAVESRALRLQPSLI